MRAMGKERWKREDASLMASDGDGRGERDEGDGGLGCKGRRDGGGILEGEHGSDMVLHIMN